MFHRHASRPIVGGCLCGGVRYSVAEPFAISGYCHCRRCQQRTGTSSAASARTVPGSLTVTEGEELLGEWAPEDGWPKVFCSRCGSALWSRSPDVAGLLAVRLGTVDGEPGIRPSYRQFVAYRAVWEEINDDLPQFPERADLAILSKDSR